MALSRKLLKGMGLTDEQVDSIIDAHTETVDGIKAERDQYKADAEKLPNVQKQLDDLQAENGGKSKYKVMYDAEHEELEKLKADIAEKEARAKKHAEMREILQEIGMPDKRIDGIIDYELYKNAPELDENGKIADRAGVKKYLKDAWSEYIPVVSDVKHTPENPLNNAGSVKLTKADIYKKDENGRYVLSASERQNALSENPELMR